MKHKISAEKGSSVDDLAICLELKPRPHYD